MASAAHVWKCEAINQQRNFFGYAGFYSSLNCLKFLKENPFSLYAYDSDVKSCLGDLLQAKYTFVSCSVPSSQFAESQAALLLLVFLP